MNVTAHTAREYLDRVKAKYQKVGVALRSKLDFGRVAIADGYIDLRTFARPDAPPQATSAS